VSSQLDLARAIEDFADRVRQRPAESVGPELDRLVQFARTTKQGERYALVSDVAPETWMQKVTLLSTQLVSPTNPMLFPYPCRIVGCDPEILLVQSGGGIVEAPPEAIELFLNIDRHENLTVRTDQQLPAGANAYVVKLNSISSRIANRLLNLEFTKNDQNLSFYVGWAVDLATVAAFSWGHLEVSLNWFVEPLDKGKIGAR
jgi:hypothetical protein